MGGDAVEELGHTLFFRFAATEGGTGWRTTKRVPVCSASSRAFSAARINACGAFCISGSCKRETGILIYSVLPLSELPGKSRFARAVRPGDDNNALALYRVAHVSS